MVPAQNHFKQRQQQHHSNSFVSCGDGYTRGDDGVMSPTSWYDYRSKACLGSELMIGQMGVMEDESRSSNNANKSGSSSKEGTKEINKDDDNRWLQLGIGGNFATDTPEMKPDPIEPTSQRHGSIELDLSLSCATTTEQHGNLLNPSNHINFSTPVMLQQPITTASNFRFHQQEVTWEYRPNAWVPSSSCSSLLLPSSMYYPQRFHHQHQDLEVVGPSSDIRVVDPPRRPHSGVWIVLQASRNQVIEPFLPQIPKNYLRIKDGRTTVRLLTKYLLSKLKLNSESEIEIRCRGQLLVPFLTLQHVRDYIWIDSGDGNGNDGGSRSNTMTWLPSSTTNTTTTTTTTTTTDHLMILHYARVCEENIV